MSKRKVSPGSQSVLEQRSAQQLKALEAEQNRRKETYTQLKQDYAKVCSTPEGLRVLKSICGITGFNRSVLSMDPNTRGIDATMTIHNAARVNIWLELRHMLTFEHRRDIENPPPEEAKEKEEIKKVNKAEEAEEQEN